MKHTYLFTVFIFLCCCRLFAQDSLKTNPIIYADVAFSPFTSVKDGLLISGSFSYQAGANLFTLKATGIGHMDRFIFNPDFDGIDTYGEAALLYGRRWISGGHSFSFSAGLALEVQTAYYSYRGSPVTQSHTIYTGLPFEAEVLWFKARRRRSRAYYIFPYGKPTGFGSSMGLNIAGNVSAHSFISFGLVFGAGYFKRY
jgi:hypothetical protein